MPTVTSSTSCNEIKNDFAIKWLVEHGAKFYCGHCGHEFDRIPELPTKCPKCGRKLTKICVPIFEPRLRIKL